MIGTSYSKLWAHNASPRPLDGDRSDVSEYPNPHLAAVVCSDQPSRILTLRTAECLRSSLATKNLRSISTGPWCSCSLFRSDFSRTTIRGDDALEKKRFFVEDAGATWHVDVYDGILNGVVIAEIELKQETQAPTLPSWVGKEVTGDPVYKKINMRARALNGRSLLT